MSLFKKGQREREKKRGEQGGERKGEMGRGIEMESEK